MESPPKACRGPFTPLLPGSWEPCVESRTFTRQPLALTSAAPPIPAGLGHMDSGPGAVDWTLGAGLVGGMGAMLKGRGAPGASGRGYEARSRSSAR